MSDIVIIIIIIIISVGGLIRKFSLRYVTL